MIVLFIYVWFENYVNCLWAVFQKLQNKIGFEKAVLSRIRFYIYIYTDCKIQSVVFTVSERSRLETVVDRSQRWGDIPNCTQLNSSSSSAKKWSNLNEKVYKDENYNLQLNPFQICNPQFLALAINKRLTRCAYTMCFWFFSMQDVFYFKILQQYKYSDSTILWTKLPEDWSDCIPAGLSTILDINISPPLSRL